MGAPPFAAGQQMLFDAHQKFVRSGMQVFLRVKNFQGEGDYIEVGVPWAPTGVDAAQTGYTDYLVEPPPNVQDVSLHNIGILAGRLNFGSRIFTISHTFVADQLRLLNQGPVKIEDPYAVWRARDGNGNTIGLVYNGRLFSIESITHREVSGTTVSWRLICNALETPMTNAPETDE